MLFFMCVNIATAAPIETKIINEAALVLADIPSDPVEPPAPLPSKSTEQQDVDFKKGIEQGRSDAKMKTPEVWREGLKKGAIYGAIDGFVFGGTIGFGGIVSFPGHVVLNNLYVYKPVEITGTSNGDPDFVQGYEQGYTRRVRLNRRASVVTGGAVTLSAVSLGLLVLIFP